MTQRTTNWIICFPLVYIFVVLAGCNSGVDPSSSTSSASSTSSSSSTSSTSTSSGVVFPPVPDYPAVRIHSVPFITVQEGSTDIFYKAEVTGLPDTIDEVSFSLSGTDSEFFVVDSSTGEVRFNDPSSVSQDSDGDNIYEVQLTAFSNEQEFDAATLAIKIAVVVPAAIDIQDFQPVFPPDQSNIGAGVTTDIGIVVRINLSSGDYANVISVTANDTPLRRNSLEQGLWVGNISIEPGQHTLLYRVTDATGQTSQYTISLGNNAVPVLVKTSHFSADAAHLYLLDAELKSILRANTDGTVVEVISGANKGIGPDLANAVHMAVDEEMGLIYVNRQNQDSPAELLEIDILTGNRRKILSYPPQIIFRENNPPVVDTYSQELFILVGNQNFSNQLLRVKGDAVQPVFDDFSLPNAQKLCLPGALTLNRAESVVYLAHNSCEDGSNRISAISLLDGSINVVASSDGSYKIDPVFGTLFDSKNRQLYIASGFGNSLYRVDFNDQSLSLVASENDTVTTLGGALTWLDQSPLIFNAHTYRNRRFASPGPAMSWQATDEFKMALPQYYGINGSDSATDLDFDGGILAMVTPGQVLMWDPTDVSTQSSWTYKAAPFNQTSPGFYTRRKYGGIELHSDDGRYYIYEYYVSRSDSFSDLSVHLITRDLNGLEIDRTLKASLSQFGVPNEESVSDYRINLTGEEFFFSDKPELDLQRPILIPGDASVEDGIGIFVLNSVLGEFYLDTKNIRTVSNSPISPPFTNYYAVTQDRSNYLAYALSKSHYRDGNLLFAISLLTGHRVIMPGGTPRANH